MSTDDGLKSNSCLTKDRLKWVGLCLLIISTVLILLGFLPIFEIQRNRVNVLSHFNPVIKEGTPTMERFRGTDQPPDILEVWLYEVVNSENVLRHQSRPSLHAIGPWMFEIHRTILDEEFSFENTLLSFRTYERYVFLENISLPINRTIIQPNLPVLQLMHNMVDNGLSGLLHGLLWGSSFFPPTYDNEYDLLFRNRTAYEVLFGYDDDPFYNTLHNIIPGIFGDNPTYYGLLNNYTSIEDFRKRGPKPDQIMTGINDSKLARQYVQYQGSRTIKSQTLHSESNVCPWGSPYYNPSAIYVCQIGGTDGKAIMPPSLDSRNETDLKTEIWTPSLFRRANLTFSYKYNVNYTESQNITLYRFHYEPEMYQNQIENPDMSIYNQEWHGVFNLTTAYDGAPISATLPRRFNVYDYRWYNETWVNFSEDNQDRNLFYDFDERTGVAVRSQHSYDMYIDIGPFNVVYDEGDDYHFMMLALQELHQEIDQDNNINNTHQDNYSPFTNPPTNPQQSNGIGSFDELNIKLQSIMNDLEDVFYDYGRNDIILNNSSSINLNVIDNNTSTRNDTFSVSSSPLNNYTETYRHTYFTNLTFSRPYPYVMTRHKHQLNDKDLEMLSANYSSTGIDAYEVSIIFISIGAILASVGLFTLIYLTSKFEDNQDANNNPRIQHLLARINKPQRVENLHNYKTKLL